MQRQLVELQRVPLAERIAVNANASKFVLWKIELTAPKLLCDLKLADRADAQLVSSFAENALHFLWHRLKAAFIRKLNHKLRVEHVGGDIKFRLFPKRQCRRLAYPIRGLARSSCPPVHRTFAPSLCRVCSSLVINIPATHYAAAWQNPGFHCPVLTKPSLAARLCRRTAHRDA